MRTLSFLLLLSGFAACKNNPAPTGSQKDTTVPGNTIIVLDSAGKVAEMSFIDGCVDNAKLTLAEPRAFAFCKCMYTQIHARYPDLDSAGMAGLDTAIVAKMAAVCR